MNRFMMIISSALLLSLLVVGERNYWLVLSLLLVGLSIGVLLLLKDHQIRLKAWSLIIAFATFSILLSKSSPIINFVPVGIVAICAILWPKGNRSNSETLQAAPSKKCR